MTAAVTVTVRMLQGMVGERLTLEPGDLYDVPPAQAKVWVEHGVAEMVKPPRTETRTPPRTSRIGPKPR